jgi:hypothetical protein
MYYVVTNFNLSLIVIDNAGFQFIDGCNENSMFKDNKINMKFIDFDSSKEGQDYEQQLRKLRREYNKESNKIVFKQIFTSDFIRRANESLQAAIDHKRIWFASKTTANGNAFTNQSKHKINLDLVKEIHTGDFIDTQDSLIYQTKKQCALIEVKSTARGTQTFDLPLHLKRSTSTSRARRDNYTTLMLGNWALGCYFDMKSQTGDMDYTFEPIMIH